MKLKLFLFFPFIFPWAPARFECNLLGLANQRERERERERESKFSNFFKTQIFKLDTTF